VRRWVYKKGEGALFDGDWWHTRCLFCGWTVRSFFSFPLPPLHNQEGVAAELDDK
jgi:hypothetical protein